MHDIVKTVGNLIIFAGAFVLVVAGVIMLDDTRSFAFTGALWIGLSLALSGVILHCFGTIIEHLIAIRKAAERQVEIFDRLGKPKA